MCHTHTIYVLTLGTQVPPPFGPPAPEDMPVWPAGSDKRRSVMRESGSVLTSEDDNDSDLGKPNGRWQCIV